MPVWILSLERRNRDYRETSILLLSVKFGDASNIIIIITIKIMATIY